MEWRVMVRLNMAIPIEYEKLVMGGLISNEAKNYQQPGAYNRYIFEAKIAPLLHAGGIRPFLFWIQRIPDLSVRPERPPMFDKVGRTPLHPAQREVYGYGPA